MSGSRGQMEEMYLDDLGRATEITLTGARARRADRGAAAPPGPAAGQRRPGGRRARSASAARWARP